MRIVFSLIVCFFLFVLLSCDDTVSVEERPLHFNREEMKYNNVIKIGDTLAVPIAVNNSSNNDYVLELSNGVIVGDSNPQFGVLDTFLIYVPTIEDLGEQSISLEIYTDLPENGGRYSDTFTVNFDVVPPFVYPNYTLRVGDTLEVFLYLGEEGAGSNISSSHGAVIDNRTLQYISDGDDLGVQPIVCSCTLPDGSINEYLTNIHVVPHHDLIVGDEWEFLDLRMESEYGRDTLTVTRRTKRVTKIEESNDSMNIYYVSNTIQSQFIEDGEGTIDTVINEEPFTFESNISFAKDSLPIVKHDNDFEVAFFKAVVVKDFAFNLFSDTTKGDKQTHIRKFLVDSKPFVEESGVSYTYVRNDWYEFHGSNKRFVLVPGIGITFNNRDYGTAVTIYAEDYTKEHMLRFNDMTIVEDTFDFKTIMIDNNF